MNSLPLTTGQKADKNRTKTGQPESLPSPLRSIRLHCLDCCLGSSQEVKLCPASDCTLHPYRSGKRPEGIGSFSPLPTIRKYCLSCWEENSSASVQACPIHDCPLYPYRLGRHPGRKGRPRTEAEKERARETFAAYRRRENA